ncbi:hypothetical protein [Paenibacillus dendrobii]|nr:hypothetical protein [Paenibacillus dendrobii]
MKADNEFLTALMNRLAKIADNTNDVDTQNELNEFIDAIRQSLDLSLNKI